jgi:hypothetical protein
MIAAQNGTASETFDWKRYPGAEAFVQDKIESALAGNAFASALAGRMHRETSTRFGDWVDHVVIGEASGLARTLRAIGFAKLATPYANGLPAFAHEGGMFPRLAVATGEGPEVREVAIKVESIASFSRAHDLGLTVLGYPMGPYRVARVPGVSTSLAVVERRGYVGFDPFSGDMARIGRMTPQAARDAIAAREVWEGRRRKFDDNSEGFDATEATLRRVIELAGGPDLACHLVFEVERDYWQSRNRAARVQKARQDRLGLGWANHDHHTYRSSRRFFPRLIGMFEALGFQLRERYHAGEQAGWGAQILEHPTTGIVIFADLDLAPDEATHDFAHVALPDLPRPNTVGLWVALHGESILEAGMHHLEAQFDFDALRDDLKADADIEVMKPFSDFPFLRQAFTAGERWAVDRRKLDRALELGLIDSEQHTKFREEGAIGSHLENLQRREGYKGFNQKSVSAILEAVDPRRQ